MASATLSSSPLLGTVLVTGGCGQLGFHLVHDLIEDPDCGPVYVLDRKVDDINVHDGATYVEGTISDVGKVESLLRDIKPRVIFHAAAPNPTFPTGGDKDQYETNVKGTEILLTAATAHPSVKAFVFTSTVDAYANPPHENVDESQSIFNASSKTWAYGRTKAMADELVRAANGPELRTVSLRTCHQYGERDEQTIPVAINTCSGNRKLFQIGTGENMMGVVSAENAAIAHSLAAKALLEPSRASGDVGGEAFNISDGVPISFWYHMRLIWTFARGLNDLVDVTILPAWLGLAVASIAEWLYWGFTFGTKNPPVSVSRIAISYCVHTHTYNIQKARERLGFSPVSNHDVVIKKAVEWELQSRLGNTVV